ncbi:MAG: hypothetical protein HOO99_08285 [Hyphomicrobiaceae bacterium]|nr:hypothetical protein [Hyphomicrobiaceae bacterium]
MTDPEKKLRIMLLSGSIALTSSVLALLVLFHRPLAPDGDAVLGTPQLVLFESDRCNWCENFRVSIGRAYNASEISARAPLRYISVDDGAPPRRYRVLGDVGQSALVIFDQYGREMDRYGKAPATADDVIAMVRKRLRNIPKI